MSLLLAVRNVPPGLGCEAGVEFTPGCEMLAVAPLEVAAVGGDEVPAVGVLGCGAAHAASRLVKQVPASNRNAARRLGREYSASVCMNTKLLAHRGCGVTYAPMTVTSGAAGCEAAPAPSCTMVFTCGA